MSRSDSPATPDAEGGWSASYEVDLAAVLGPFARGGADPCTVVTGPRRVWRACRTPDGPGTLRIDADRLDVSVAAWGPGASWLVASVPDLLGFADQQPSESVMARLPEHLAPAWRRLARSWRVPRSRLVLEALVAAVLEQKVTGVQSRRAWRSLVVETGDPAPGPAPRPMHTLPDAADLRRVPSWTWHRWGVTPHQAAALQSALASPGRLAECADLSHDRARARLRAIRGIGEWTTSEVAQRALGDADAVSFGDFHLANQVVHAFTGERNGTDERMGELLAPFAGHRYRVQRAVERSGIVRPARGPRMTISDHRRH
jgi:3-methyladenine DNA glycosylase/8-oxoguanine DNA glycosylase